LEEEDIMGKLKEAIERIIETSPNAPAWVPTFNRWAIRASGILVFARRSLAKRALPGSPFRRLAKSCC